MTDCLKSAAGTLRLELAQYREMKVFTQFSNYLDDEMQKSLRAGEILMNALKQEQGAPYSEWQQVAILTAATSRCLDDVDDADFGKTVRRFLRRLYRDRNDIVDRINGGQKLSQQDKEDIAEVAKAVCDDK